MMWLKDIKDEDFVNYKKPSMFIAMGKCNFKCCRDAGVDNTVCQNHALHSEPDMEVNENDIVDRYLGNEITQAVVLGGLDPFDDFPSMWEFIHALRFKSHDDIVIYTGYEMDEVERKLSLLSQYPNILVKFGRYKPNGTPVYNELLGVTLASDNQYARWLGEPNHDII